MNIEKVENRVLWSKQKVAHIYNFLASKTKFILNVVGKTGTLKTRQIANVSNSFPVRIVDRLDVNCKYTKGIVYIVKWNGQFHIEFTSPSNKYFILSDADIPLPVEKLNVTISNTTILNTLKELNPSRYSKEELKQIVAECNNDMRQAVFLYNNRLGEKDNELTLFHFVGKLVFNAGDIRGRYKVLDKETVNSLYDHSWAFDTAIYTLHNALLNNIDPTEEYLHMIYNNYSLVDEMLQKNMNGPLTRYIHFIIVSSVLHFKHFKSQGQLSLKSHHISARNGRIREDDWDYFEFNMRSTNSPANEDIEEFDM